MAIPFSQSLEISTSDREIELEKTIDGKSSQKRILLVLYEEPSLRLVNLTQGGVEYVERNLIE